MYGSSDISSASSREDLPAVAALQPSASQQQELSQDLQNGSLREHTNADDSGGEDLEGRVPVPVATSRDALEGFLAPAGPPVPLPDLHVMGDQLGVGQETGNGSVVSTTPPPVPGSTPPPSASGTPIGSSTPIASSAPPSRGMKAASLFPIGPPPTVGVGVQSMGDGTQGAPAGSALPAARSAAALFPVDALGPTLGAASRVPPPASMLAAPGVGSARSFPGFPLPSAEPPARLSTRLPALSNRAIEISTTDLTLGPAPRVLGPKSDRAELEESEHPLMATESANQSGPSGITDRSGPGGSADHSGPSGAADQSGGATLRGEEGDSSGRQAALPGRAGGVVMEEASGDARGTGAGQAAQVQGSSRVAVDGRHGAAVEGPQHPGRPGNLPPRDIQAIIEKLVAFVKVRTYARGLWCGAVPAGFMGRAQSRCGAGALERASVALWRSFNS